MIVHLVFLIAGLGLVTLGAELLVRGSSRGAARLGLSPLVVGLTVVAFGTSAPEAAISVLAVVQGQGDLALGNVVGSNIFNVLLILGATALVAPLLVNPKLTRVDVPILVGVSALVLLMAWDGAISRFEGAVLLGGLAGYLIFTVRQARREARDAAGRPTKGAASLPGSLWRDAGLLLAGLGLLVGGAHVLVTGAAALARAVGLSELVVGLTILAAGTGIPEVATSLVAAIRGQRDIAVGNAIGSSLFNLLFVLGAAALLSTGVPVASGALHFDLPVMMATAVACVPIFWAGYRIERWKGALLLTYYAAYLGYLILDATAHPAAGPFARVVLLFVAPATAIALLIMLLRSMHPRMATSLTPEEVTQ